MVQQVILHDTFEHVDDLLYQIWEAHFNRLWLKDASHMGDAGSRLGSW